MTLPAESLSSRSLTTGARISWWDVVGDNLDENLVNEIGHYNGQRPVVSTGPVTFDIKADGAWTIRAEALQTGGIPAFAGTGDAVGALFSPPQSGPWDVSHTGKSNFMVDLHCAGGDVNLENEIGKLQASTLARFPKGPCFWEIRADGAWSLQPRP